MAAHEQTPTSPIHLPTPEALKRLGRYDFPNPISADPEGTGLVAMGGDLDITTLLSAYAQGLFPWFNADEPIVWWCPEPRCVLYPEGYVPSKSLRRQVKNSPWQLSVNRAFVDVIHACSLPRQDGLPEGEHTWIHEEMIEAYTELHEQGYAHSIEVWDEAGALIGGLYGLKIGGIYFGESMFHQASNASKIAFWALVQLCRMTHVELIDCQLENPHLMSLGASTLPRTDFLQRLDTLLSTQSPVWQAEHYPLIPVRALLTETPWQAMRQSHIGI
ncbi:MULTISPECIES: leucyl/phenylalanyl-tRNA--protein transferase [unclassified Psychrobacter]|uniref:leucyl/phenylalanyl-tRNA--protein transferase n=1 Tax=unclassified Psychrobacter TaxID=196806 RepID=UPI0018F3523A|nr:MULTISPECIES: leucyl/phenylalanyl-tRNA--protein transferase [unclassified Psychrobacter]